MAGKLPFDASPWLLCPQEMATAVMLDLHLTVILLNDNAYGMIKWKQTGMQFSDFGLDLENPDFVKYAEAYGARGYRIKSCQEFSTTLQHCLTTHGVHLVEVPITYATSDILQVRAGGFTCTVAAAASTNPKSTSCCSFCCDFPLSYELLLLIAQVC